MRRRKREEREDRVVRNGGGACIDREKSKVEFKVRTKVQWKKKDIV